MNDKKLDLKLYQVMHQFGKLISCNANKPSTSDKLFVDEIKKVIRNDK